MESCVILYEFCYNYYCSLHFQFTYRIWYWLLLNGIRFIPIINNVRKKFTKNILTIKETQVIIPYIKIFVQRADNGVWERIPLTALFCVLRRFLLLFTHHYPARCFGMNMPKSRDIQAKIPLPQAIWNEFWLRYWERSEQ